MKGMMVNKFRMFCLSGLYLIFLFFNLFLVDLFSQEEIYLPNGKIVFTDLDNDGKTETVIVLASGFGATIDEQEKMFMFDKRLKFLNDVKGLRIYTKSETNRLRINPGLEIIKDKKSIFYKEAPYDDFEPFYITDLDKNGTKEIFVGWEHGVSSCWLEIWVIGIANGVPKILFDEVLTEGNAELNDIDNNGKKEIITSEAFGPCNSTPGLPDFIGICIYKMDKGKIKLYKKYFLEDLHYAYQFDVNKFIEKYKKKEKCGNSQEYYLDLIKKLKPVDKNDFPKDMNPKIVS